MTRARLLLVAAGCTAAGALGAGTVGTLANGGLHQRGHHGVRGLAGAVHAEVVVPRRDNTFTTVTFDRGEVVSVAGRDLTIREGTRDATYKTVTLTLPDDARVRIRRDGDAGPDALSDLRAGDRVRVRQSTRRTVVLARRVKG
jgi:hypothetical protein